MTPLKEQIKKEFRELRNNGLRFGNNDDEIINYILDRQLEEIRKQLPEKQDNFLETDFENGYETGFNNCLREIKEILK